MTLFVCLALLVPLGFLLPGVVVRRVSGAKGVALGAAAALLVGVGVVYAVGFAVAALRGTDPALEVEAAFNAWKLLIFLAPAAGLHARRQQAKSRDD